MPIPCARALYGPAQVGALTKLTKTLDQARTVLTAVDVVSEKTLRGVVAITAGRGRVRDSHVYPARARPPAFAPARAPPPHRRALWVCAQAV